jgi:prevent-host-death family protein
MASKTTASIARQKFSDILNRAAYGGERVVVHRGNKPIAALVPMEDFEILEQIEDRADLEEVRKRLNEPTIPWSRIKKELGL